MPDKISTKKDVIKMKHHINVDDEKSTFDKQLNGLENFSIKIDHFTCVWPVLKFWCGLDMVAGLEFRS